MSSESSRKKKIRRRQESTGESYLRARRALEHSGDTAEDTPSWRGIPMGLAPGSEGQLRELLGLGRSGVPDVTETWKQRELPAGSGASVNFGPFLRVPIGLRANGSAVWLDLKDEAVDEDGPHSTVVGASGSGKSEMLRAMVFALCVQHSPEVLKLVLVHYESTFTDFASYPHVSALLEGALVG